MALALALPLLGSAILVSVQPVAREMSVTPEVTVFMRVDAPAGAAADVAKRIKDEYSQDVRAARVVGRDAALADLRANPAWQQALAVLPGNPLPGRRGRDAGRWRQSGRARRQAGGRLEAMEPRGPGAAR